MTKTKKRKGKRRIKATRRKQLKNKVNPKRVAHILDTSRKNQLERLNKIKAAKNK
ncbi:hypothetical protein ACFLZZ_03715 [Nanoarchaeota archaeon]